MMGQEHRPIFTLNNDTKVAFKEIHTGFVSEHSLDRLQ